MKDLTDFEINHSMEEIKTIDEEAWKKLIKCKTTEKSLTYLNFNIASRSRKYDSLEMSNYLTSKNEEFGIETEKFIAKLQTHVVKTVKTNFKEKYKPNFLCNLCKLHECNQSHLLYCEKLIGSNELVSYIQDYVDSSFLQK